MDLTSFEIIVDEVSEISNFNNISRFLIDYKNIVMEETDNKYKLYISKLSLSRCKKYSFNDGISKGCFLLSLASRIFNEYDYICLENFFDTKNKKIIYGGSGVITHNGLNKNAFYALLYLRKLGTNIIFCDSNIIASKKTETEYVLVVNNFVGFSFNIAPMNNIKNTKFNLYNRTINLNIILQNVKNGTYKIKKYTNTLDSPQLNEIFSKIDSEIHLESDELEKINEMCTPKLELNLVKSNNSELSFDINLESNDFAMLYIYYQF